MFRSTLHFTLLALIGLVPWSSEALAQAVCDVQYQINSQWNSGQNVTLVLRNPTTQEIDGWELSWQMPGGEQITNLWNGTHTQTGSSVRVRSESYNALIPPGGSVTFGFNATGSGNSVPPSSFALDGVPCDGAGAPAGQGMPDRFSRFVAPADGDILPRTFSVQMVVGGLRVEPAGPVNPNAGHLHILVDTDFVEPGESIPFDAMHLHYGKGQLDAELSLEPGPHTLRLQFADGQHVALPGTEYMDTIRVNVAENMILEPADGATVPSTFTVRMRAPGLIVEPAGMVNPGAGHLHLLVDTDFIEPGQAIPFDAMHLHYGKGQMEAELNLEPGEHTIKLQFADGTHVTLDGPQYRDEIRVVVADAAAPAPDAGDGNAAGTPPPPPAQPSPSLTGEARYASQCAGCHGDDGRGLGTFPGVLRDYSTRQAFLQKIIDDMPLSNPASCGADCAAAVTAYIEQTLRPAQGLSASVTGGMMSAGGAGSTPPVAGGGGSADPSTPAPDPDPISTPQPMTPRTRPALNCSAGETPAPRMLRLLTRREYDNTVQDLLGVRTPLADSLPVEARIEGYDNNAGVNIVTARHVDAYLAAASDLVDRALQQNRGGIIPCDPNSGDACAQRFVQTLGLRAYRRPLTQEESDRLLALFRGAGGFDAGVRQTLTAMLISPNFLYRSELGRPAGGMFRLTSYEVASSLSYLFLGSMPDDALFEAAAADRLRDPQDLLDQAQRLLASPRARARIGVFAAQWLGADPFQTGEKDPAVYPNYTPAVQQATDAELVAFVNHVIFESTGRYPELLTADYVFANSALSRFYGVPGVNGSALQKVPVQDGSRGGVLGLGSVLAAHAHSDDSSPVKRGVFVRERMLCHDLPDPPPAIDNTPPGLDASLTTRERFAAHSASPFCQTCHQYIDGVGFGLEGYNGAGEFRRNEFGIPVDDSGSIRALMGFDPDNLNGSFPSVDFSGLRELSTLVSTSPDAPDCLATQYFRYARGYIESSADACAVDRMQQLFAESDYDLKTLLMSIVSSPSFSLRRAEENR